MPVKPTGKQHNDMLTELQGQIERITYTSEESGFTVARVKVPGRHDLVTVVGSLMAPMPGEIIRMQGEWANHPKHGEQFKIVQYKSLVPATVQGLEKYLGSGLIKGIGPVMAKRIAKRFGKETLDIIEAELDKLAEVDGIGPKRIEMIRKAWAEQKEIREVMLFLQGHGVSSGYATKIFKQYGNESIKVVKENPYRLATDIFGIGFITADKIAEKLGFSKDSELRAEAGILYVLHQLSDEGHVYYPYEPLVEKCKEIPQVEREVIVKAFATIAIDKRIVIEDLDTDVESYKGNNKAIYLAKFHLSETGIASRLKMLVNSPKATRKSDADKAVERVQGKLAITLAERQIEAIKCAIQNKVMVITGGPGTGKTTIVNAILKIFKAVGTKIMLGAPTGRAAKRMSEATGHEAKTIHRMLEYSLKKAAFQKNAQFPLGCDLLIVDEASMIDTILMYHIAKIDFETQEVIISFDGRDVDYDFTDLDEVVLAYAVSVHKSQGSEYPAVVIPILTQHYVLLQRNLIYTGITRGRKLVVMVGTKRALAIGVKDNKTQMRYTRLKQRLS